MTRKGILSFAIASILAVAATGSAVGQPGPGGPGGPRGRWGGPGMGLGFGPGFARLQLSDQQKSQIHDLMQQSRTDQKAAADSLRQLEQQLHAEVYADTPDSSKIEALKAQIAAAQANMLAARVSLELQIAQVLTADQRAQLRQPPQRPNGPPSPPQP